MLFANGKPLGENGLDWLKIHLVNLHGEKKKYLICNLTWYPVFYICIGFHCRVDWTMPMR